MKGVVVRVCGVEDRAQWLAMRRALWPDASEGDATDWAAREDAATLIAEDGVGGAVMGFAEVGSRAYADGCSTSPVAFLEGWYVVPAMRGRGVGRELVRACVAWSRQQGMVELASDSLLEDEAAQLAHRAVGFEEVERSVKYRLALD